MSGASARLSAALDCVLSDHTVQCKRDGHAGWNGPEHVKLGSDSHGNFMVQLPCVVAIARQIDLRSANEWLRRLTQAEKSNVVVSERTWASSNNMTVRSCPVADVQKVMEFAASKETPQQCRGGKGQSLDNDQIRHVFQTIQKAAQEQSCLKMMQLRANMAAAIGGDATKVDSGEGTLAHAALQGEKRAAVQAHATVRALEAKLRIAERKSGQLAADLRSLQVWCDVPPNVQDFLDVSPGEHLAAPETTGLAVPVALCLTTPHKSADGTCVMKSLGCVLQEEDTSEESMDTLEAIMRFVFVHVTRPEEFSDDQECKTNDDVVAQAFEDATTPLHRILRSLVTGTREYASKHDFRNEDAVRALVLPWVLAEIVRKSLNKQKCGGLQGRMSQSLYEDPAKEREDLFRRLGLVMAKQVWEKREIVELGEILKIGGRLCCNDDVLVYIFDNLGYGRKVCLRVHASAPVRAGAPGASSACS